MLYLANTPQEHSYRYKYREKTTNCGQKELPVVSRHDLCGGGLFPKKRIKNLAKSEVVPRKRRFSKKLRESQFSDFNNFNMGQSVSA